MSQADIEQYGMYYVECREDTQQLFVNIFSEFDFYLCSHQGIQETGPKGPATTTHFETTIGEN